MNYFNKEWTKKKAKTSLISYFRQFVVQEYSGEQLYKNLPKNISSVQEVEQNVYSKGKDFEIKEFFELISTFYKGFLPYSTSIHKFLQKNDTVWYKNNLG